MNKYHTFALLTISLLLPHSLAWSQDKPQAKIENKAKATAKTEPEAEPEATATDDKKEQPATLTILTDLTKAKLLAQKHNKPVFLEFMSSTCGHCQAFKKNVISKPSFIDYANQNLITVIHDYQDLSKLPADEKKNREALMEKLKIDSFPTILLISPQGKILLRKSGYNGTSAEKIIETLKKATISSRAQ